VFQCAHSWMHLSQLAHHVGGVSIVDGVDAPAEIVEGVSPLLPEGILHVFVQHALHRAPRALQILHARNRVQSSFSTHMPR